MPTGTFTIIRRFCRFLFSGFARTRALVILALPLLAGCAATLEDFQQMSSYERTEYICERHNQVRHFSSQASAYWRSVTELESVIARGYRIHETCKQVQVVKSSGQTCHYVGYTLICRDNTYTDYETICEEQAVAIDGALEKEKLQDARKNFRLYTAQYDRAFSQCRARTQNLTPEAAFHYYQSIR